MKGMNVSVWRGDTTPPTTHHVWIKDKNNILLYNNGRWENVTSQLALENRELLELLKENTYTKEEVDEKLDKIHISEKIDLRSPGTFEQLIFGPGAYYDPNTKSYITSSLTIKFPEVSTWGYEIKLADLQTATATIGDQKYPFTGILVNRASKTDQVDIIFSDKVNIASVYYWQIAVQDKISDLIDDVEEEEEPKHYVENETLFILN